MTELLLIISAFLNLITGVILVFFGYKFFKKDKVTDKMHHLICDNNRLLSKYKAMIDEEVKGMKS